MSKSLDAAELAMVWSRLEAAIGSALSDSRVVTVHFGEERRVCHMVLRKLVDHYPSDLAKLIEGKKP